MVKAEGSTRHAGPAASLERLDARARWAAALLAVASRPLPAATVFADAQASAALALLARGGVVLLDQDLVVLAPEWCDYCRARLDADARAALERALLTTLRGGVHSDPVALEVLRLAARHRLWSEVTQLLERRSARLLRGGFGREVWAAIRHAIDAVPYSLRLDAALHAGPAAWREIEEPTGADPALRSQWARLLYARGELRASLESLGACGGTDADADLALLIEFARCEQSMGHADRAVAVLAARACAGDLTGEALALWALSCATAGQRRDALVALARLHETPAPAGCTRAWVWAAQARYELGMLEAASEELDRLGPTAKATGAAWALAAAIEFDAGRLGNLERLLRDRARRSDATVVTAIAIETIDAMRRVAGGDFGNLDVDVQDLAARAARHGLDYPLVTAATARVQCAIADAAPDAGLCAEAAGLATAGASLPQRLLAIDVAELELRSGQSSAPPPASGPSDPVELCVAGDRLRALSALLVGDHAGAQVHARDGIDLARESGHRQVLARVLEVAIDGSLVRGQSARARADAEQLRALADSMPSARWRATAEWALAVTDSEPDWPVLERLSLRRRESPASARRARWLLGDRPRVDRVDDAVLRALVAQGHQRCELRRTDGVDASLGIDLDRELAWTAAGSLDLRGRPVLWALLRALADLGDHADKERLVERVWRECHYHPLRHDNRLKLAIKKLRGHLQGLGNDVAIATTDRGYALCGALRVCGCGTRRQ